MPSMQDVLKTLPKHEPLEQQPSMPERLDAIPDARTSEPETEASEPLQVELHADHITSIPNSHIDTASKQPVAAPTQSMPSTKDPLTRDIEKILEENLAESFATMTPEQQQKFKTEGERVTASIRQIIKSGVVHIKKILALISGWLRMIPGVNRFFLEKESKIKAEKILLLGGQF